MEFYAYAFAAAAASSSTSSCSTTSIASSLLVCLEIIKKFTFGAALKNITSSIIALFIGTVGTLLGAINGAIIGQQSEKQCFRGAVVGAVSGALLSIEVFESFLRLWSSQGKGIQCLLYLGDVLISLANGKIVRERVGPILMINVRPVQYTDTVFEEFFEDNFGNKGLSADVVEKIPTVEITSENNADSCGQSISCSVCLEDFLVGEEARTLPSCNHMFHPSCIDEWLTRCGSCPLCRRNL